ncbi:hypothetical protein FH972_024154 [Carpinus fangiana]|uniref:Uncharacterized protein n=1 Tax=Carpinus fangiana TaxID=176857 RepID=A0A5N6KY11_9ROSI|nr:hypothetical protein FH972_024154 [Carpinus fangiana]
MSTTKKLRTLTQELTLEEAKGFEVANVLLKLEQPRRQAAFFQHLNEKRDCIQAAAARHLNISPDRCRVAETTQWLKGSFNLCVPLVIEGTATQSRVLMRFPAPYLVGEDFHPGNSDEKLRCEAGVYAWLQDACPSIPIPQLYGFAVSTGQQFTSVAHLPLLSRWFHSLRRRVLLCLGYSPSSYVRHQNHSLGLKDLGVGYLLLEFIEPTKAQMLSNTWQPQDGQCARRSNLFRGLAKILVTLSHVPLPRIGSFTIDDKGLLSLTNRPMTWDIFKLENEHVPTDIPRDLTYSTTDSFVSDILHLHRSRLRHLLNAANNKFDCLYQMQTLTLARSLFPLLFRRDLRHGPFILALPDLHQSNILVDEDWNIVKIIDLEFAASLPIECQHTPTWLTGEGTDQLTPDTYDPPRQEFMRALKEEEERIHDQEGTLSSIMEQGWVTGTFWAALALQSPTALFAICTERILPAFTIEDDAQELSAPRLLMKLWGLDYQDLSEAKAADKQNYDKQLEEVFEKA